MRTRAIGVGVAVVLGMMIAACGSSTAPTPLVTLTGNWSGNDNFGSINMTLQQTGQSLGGTFSTSGGGSGTVSGTVAAGNVSLDATLIPSVPGRCMDKVTATVASGMNLIQGTWVTLNCTVFSSSTFSVARR